MNSYSAQPNFGAPASPAGSNPARPGGFPGANSPGPVADLYGTASQDSGVGNYISAASPQPGSGFSHGIAVSTACREGTRWGLASFSMTERRAALCTAPVASSAGHNLLQVLRFPRATGVAMQTGNSCLSLSCTNVACFERPYLTDTSFCLSRWASHQWNGPLRPVCCLQAVCLASPPTQRRRRVPGTPGLPVSQQWHRAMGAWSFQPLPYRHRCAAEDVGMGGGRRLIGAP